MFLKFFDKRYWLSFWLYIFFGSLISFYKNFFKVSKTYKKSFKKCVTWGHLFKVLTQIFDKYLRKKSYQLL